MAARTRSSLMSRASSWSATILARASLARARASSIAGGLARRRARRGGAAGRRGGWTGRGRRADGAALADADGAGGDGACWRTRSAPPIRSRRRSARGGDAVGAGVGVGAGVAVGAGVGVARALVTRPPCPNSNAKAKIATNTPIDPMTNTADARSLTWTACCETDGGPAGAVRDWRSRAPGRPCRSRRLTQLGHRRRARRPRRPRPRAPRPRLVVVGGVVRSLGIVCLGVVRRALGAQGRRVALLVGHPVIGLLSAGSACRHRLTRPTVYPAPPAPGRPGPSRLSQRLDPQPTEPGGHRHQATRRDHGTGPEHAHSSPPTAIAIDIPPNTRAKRRLTTRPISSGGVRSWNSVWLGMTNAMLATPQPNSSPRTSGIESTMPTMNTSAPKAV